MTNAELIDALQCTRHFALYQDCYEKNCYANSGKGLYCNIPKLMADAADALEAAEKRIEELERSFSDVCNANGSLACERNKLLNDVRELEAQIPKEGEWIMDKNPHDGDCRCSACLVAIDAMHERNHGLLNALTGGKWWKFYRFCPNCGARMRTVTDCHTLEEGER